MSEVEDPAVQSFLNLCAQANSQVKTRIYPEERERVFQRVLDHVVAHPDERSTHAEAFRTIIFGHRGITDDLVRFCMRKLRWPEIVDAVHKRMSQDIHNSEYESL